MPIGPTLPPHLLTARSDSESDEDDYTPALPAHLVNKSTTKAPAQSEPPTGVQPGPSRPFPLPEDDSEDDDDDDDIGPKPAASTSTSGEVDGVQRFVELEERRRKNAEVGSSQTKSSETRRMDARPPSASEVLGNIDPTRLTKPRTFAKSSNSSAAARDQSLWTETPQQREQRLADEVSGKKRRAVNAEDTPASVEEEMEKRKRRKIDEATRKGVEEHTKQYRGSSLVEQYTSNTPKDEEDPKAHLIWDHQRDMSLGGRLMDDSQRSKIIRESKGLGDRFGSGSKGSFL
ncbi:hypothetical protein DL96DRAFT_1667172 [Flagelloscypha sp. PMI_526]|nr:hypothetical protein DL96DRAFT_1667172 [Flagelloscypha sp. PMI_526]